MSKNKIKKIITKYTVELNKLNIADDTDFERGVMSGKKEILSEIISDLKTMLMVESGRKKFEVHFIDKDICGCEEIVFTHEFWARNSKEVEKMANEYLHKVMDDCDIIRIVGEKNE